MSFLRRHRRLTKVSVISVSILLAAAFVASRTIGSLFRARLTAAVAQKLDADLTLGPILYRPPFTFYARDIHLAAHHPTARSFQTLEAAGMELTLHEFPRRGRMPWVDRLVLGQAELNWGQTDQTIALDRIGLSFHQPPDSNVLEWVTTFTNGPLLGGKAEGKFDAKAGWLECTTLSIAGRIAPAVEKLPLPARVRSAIASVAPDGRLSVLGSLILPLHDIRYASYQFTLDLDDASAQIPRWKAHFEHGAGRVHVKNASFVDGRPPQIAVDIDYLRIGAGTSRVRMDGGNVLLSPATDHWGVSQIVGAVELGDTLPFSPPRSGWFFNQGRFHGPVEFTLAADGPFRVHPAASAIDVIHHELLAYPYDVSVQPRGFQAPIAHIAGGPIAFRGGVISFDDLSGDCGEDRLLLHQARLVLEDRDRRIGLEDLRTQVRFEELDGTVIFSPHGPGYPGVVGKTIAQLRPRGPFVIGGGSWYAVNRMSPGREPRRLKPDFFIRLDGDGGSFGVTPYEIPLTSVHGRATMTPMSVVIDGFTAEALGGTVWANGRIAPGRPFLYDGRIDARDMDLSRLAPMLPLKRSDRGRVSGLGSFAMRLSGAGPSPERSAADALSGEGTCEIVHGDFWSVAPVHEAAGRIRSPEELGTGDAAAVFRVDDGTVTLDSAAVNSPLLGLQGTGTIRLDGSLDLTVVAAPLGDWRDRMRQMGVPIVGDVLGAVQRLLNTAQGALLYQLRITGTASRPVTALIPAPVLTEPMAALFGRMLNSDRQEKLLTDVKSQTRPTDDSAGLALPAAAMQRN